MPIGAAMALPMCICIDLKPDEVFLDSIHDT
jgi:hypothetical protein